MKIKNKLKKIHMFWLYQIFETIPTTLTNYKYKLLIIFVISAWNFNIYIYIYIYIILIYIYILGFCIYIQFGGIWKSGGMEWPKYNPGVGTPSSYFTQKLYLNVGNSTVYDLLNYINSKLSGY